MKVWVIVGIVLLALLAACAKEQHAVPIAQQTSQVANQTMAQPVQPAHNATNTTPAGTQNRTPQTNVSAAPVNTTVHTNTTVVQNSSVTHNTTTLDDTLASNTTDICSDSDGGDRPGVKGIVTLHLSNRTVLKTDSCIGTVLSEYYCDLDSLQEKQYSCNGGCLNGVCTGPSAS